MSALKPIVTALATLHNQVLVLPLLEAREHLHHYFPSPEDVAPMVLALREALEQLVVIPLIFTSNHVTNRTSIASNTLTSVGRSHVSGAICSKLRITWSRCSSTQ